MLPPDEELELELDPDEELHVAASSSLVLGINPIVTIF